MRFRIIRHMSKSLKNREVKETFSDFVEMRQRLFEAQFSKALCLDRYDLISDHIVLYEDSGFKTPIAYMRSVTSEICRQYEIPIPIVLSISHSPSHLEAYRRFEAVVRMPVNMGFLCLDQRYKEALGRIKIIELLTWVAFNVAGVPTDGMGLCATINSKFNQNAWLENVGKAVEGIPRLTHPVIPDPHDLTLIPEIRTQYWAEQQLKFGALLEDAEWLVPQEELGRKRAA